MTAEEKNSNFSYTIKTEKTIDKAIEDLTTNLKDIGFGVMNVLNFKEILQKKGVDYHKEYQLMEVCNPVAAKQVLEVNPEMGLLLPCTIALYQRENQTWISLAKPTSLLANIQDKQFDKLGKEMEEKLVNAIEKAK